MADTSKVIIFNSPYTNQLAITMVSGRCDKTIDELAKMTVPNGVKYKICLLYTSPSPRDRTRSRMPSSA